jgi:glycerophosphoryl diester phosphodiesterase
LRASSGEWISRVPIAHRGLHGDGRPENSLAAFEAALEAGYGIELDVHLTTDHRLAVLHDVNASRSTGHDLMITECPSSEVRELRLVGSEQMIPFLEDVLELVQGRVPVLVEAKPGSPAATIGPVLHSVIREYRGPLAVQSFDPSLVLWFRRHAPDVLRGQLSGTLAEDGLAYTRRVVRRYMVMNVLTRPHFIAYEVGAMPSLAVSTWRRVLGVPLVLWTVERPDGESSVRRHRANMIFEFGAGAVAGEEATVTARV